LEQIQLESSTTSAFTGNTLFFHSESGRENYNGGTFYNAAFGPQYDFVGINLDSPNVIFTATEDLTFKSELLYTNNGNFKGTALGGPIQFNAKENFEVMSSGETTLTLGSSEFVSKQGLYLEGSGATYTATNSLVINGGKDDVSGNIRFVSPNNLNFIATAAVSMESDNNILMEDSGSITIQATGHISIHAHRGDILFRSISVSPTIYHEKNFQPDTFFDVNFQSTDGSINMGAGRSIRFINHWGLGFFYPNLQADEFTAARKAPEDVAAFQQVAEGVYNPGGNFPACHCFYGGCTSCSCNCPDAANRIVQMYNALINYGLILNVG